MTLASRQLVLDASAVVAMLTDRGVIGEWVSHQIHAARTTAPHHMPFEADNVLRRYELMGVLDPATACSVHDDLVGLDIGLYPHHLLGERIWALRRNVTVYDASYVALAELLDAPLVTLDARLARASGPRCDFLVYDG